MNLISLRMMAVSLGAVGFIAACGSSGSSLGNSFGPVPGAVIASDATAPPSEASAPASSSSGTSAEDSGASTAPAAATCNIMCSTDEDCSSCGSQTWCCMAGTCYVPKGNVCPTTVGGGDAGSADESDDDGSAAPAPSM